MPLHHNIKDDAWALVFCRSMLRKLRILLSDGAKIEDQYITRDYFLKGRKMRVRIIGEQEYAWSKRDVIAPPSGDCWKLMVTINVTGVSGGVVLWTYEIGDGLGEGLGNGDPGEVLYMHNYDAEPYGEKVSISFQYGKETVGSYYDDLGNGVIDKNFLMKFVDKTTGLPYETDNTSLGSYMNNYTVVVIVVDIPRTLELYVKCDAYGDFVGY